ncbi:MAG: hypothetical protein NXH75_02930 [Halobacteriovoraceae bacterium]|nr:hypothetical protein [Halobacteriovoraceae bacterium]
MDGKWLSISEYSSYRDISISTIRRYIKANRVRFKKENGKYLIFVSDENYILRSNQKEREDLTLRLEIHELKDRIRILEEENNDLKMLVQIYEQKLKSPSLPELPGY